MKKLNILNFNLSNKFIRATEFTSTCLFLHTIAYTRMHTNMFLGTFKILLAFYSILDTPLKFLIQFRSQRKKLL